jgi:hypothetical protein
MTFVREVLNAFNPIIERMPNSLHRYLPWPYTLRPISTRLDQISAALDDFMAPLVA